MSEGQIVGTVSLSLSIFQKEREIEKTVPEDVLHLCHNASGPSFTRLSSLAQSAFTLPTTLDKSMTYKSFAVNISFSPHTTQRRLWRILISSS